MWRCVDRLRNRICLCFWLAIFCTYYIPYILYSIVLTRKSNCYRSLLPLAKGVFPTWLRSQTSTNLWVKRKPLFYLLVPRLHGACRRGIKIWLNSRRNNKLVHQRIRAIVRTIQTIILQQRQAKWNQVIRTFKPKKMRKKFAESTSQSGTFSSTPRVSGGIQSLWPEAQKCC